MAYDSIVSYRVLTEDLSNRSPDESAKREYANFEVCEIL